ncbi:hypothetical protein [Streptomyces sp. NPDC054783]
MRADTFPGRVLAVLSRRSPAFRPRPGQPATVAGALRHWLRASPRVSASTGIARVSAPDPTGIARTTASMYAWDPLVRIVMRARVDRLHEVVDVARDRAYSVADSLDRLARVHWQLSRIEAFGDAFRAAEDCASAVTEARERAFAVAVEIENGQVRQDIHAFAAAIAEAFDAATSMHRVSTYQQGRHVSPTAVEKARAQAFALAQEFAVAAEALTRVRDDFRGAALTDAVLDDLPLAGVTWDVRTSWPLSWDDRIRRASDRIGPGVYVVRTDPHEVPAPSHT